MRMGLVSFVEVEQSKFLGIKMVTQVGEARFLIFYCGEQVSEGKEWTSCTIGIAWKKEHQKSALHILKEG